jgi:hypothetical protein
MAAWWEEVTGMPQAGHRGSSVFYRKTKVSRKDSKFSPIGHFGLRSSVSRPLFTKPKPKFR